MSQSTPLLDLPLIQEAQAQKHVTHNEAVVALDALVQPVALDADRAAPPAAPAEGDRHLVAGPATGAWAGREGALALFSNGGWDFRSPRAGWRVHVLALGADLVFDGAAWARPGRLGVNAEADATNRLAVSAPATLLTHEGAGHQVKVNKAAAPDTASLLFQTGWSGRAEMGLSGSDAFSVKVSADGAAWETGLAIDPATGRVDVPASHGSWTPVLGTTAGGDLAAATGLTAVYAWWWKVGPLVTLQMGIDFAGVPAVEFTQKSTFSLDGLPFAPRDSSASAIDQGGVTGFVYRHIGNAQVSLVSGGVGSDGRLYGFVFHTGAGEARQTDRFHLRASYLA
ncbi:DUF2793 domain-containing protein [Jannaschia formosa]|uniref:DUF2793 domain-containing protein n=1 Tax=Jannaschia formosa TaxID=2259592 RepID=UPI000E1C0BC6|nr:DUF2793 domain-containing protein [Jannaschia formosa]TFL17094.1 DUF2793 domain-containing protein [Jannaschia formosa]